jgi:hypothetical protein
LPFLNVENVVCENSGCTYDQCVTGFADCDGVPANGCEVDTMTTSEHCSMCGQQCPALDNAGTKCEGGNCVIDQCAQGYGSCDNQEITGCETDLMTTKAHCGQCNMACPAAETCAGGMCTSTCKTVSGILWCYHPTECGKACNDVCATVNLTPMADKQAWFEAQNTVAKCKVLMNAFNLQDYQMAGYAYACLEYEGGLHPNGHVPVNKLLCSTNPNCPNQHLTKIDQQDNPCSAPISRVAICPCE